MSLALPHTRALLGGTAPSWVVARYHPSGSLPDLAFDFTTNRMWEKGAGTSDLSRLSVTRAISGTGHTADYAVNSSGVWVPFGANTLRQTDLGVTVEESRTNSIRNNSMVNATVNDGNELVTNSAFPSNISGWTYVTAGTSTITWTSAGTVTVHGDGTNTTSIEQAITTVIGKSYTVRVDVTSSTGAARLDVSTSPGGGQIVNAFALVSGINGTGEESANIIGFTATSTTTYVKIRKSAAGDTLLNKVSVQLGSLPFVTSGTQPWTISAMDKTMNCVVSGTGTENGVNYVDVHINGTAIGDHLIVRYEAPNGVAASNSSTWTASAFHKIVAGDLTGITHTYVGIYMTNGSAVLSPEYLFDQTLTNTLQRFSSTQLLSNASISNVFSSLSVYLTPAATIDVTIRIGWPQLELGSFATTPIPTTSAAVTRNADVVSMALMGMGSAYSMYAKGVPVAPAGYATTQAIMQADDGTGSSNQNRVIMSRQGSAGTMSTSSISANVTQFMNSAAVLSAGSTGKFGVSVASVDQAFYANGVASGTAAGNLPIALNTLKIGVQGQSNSQQWDGTLQESAVWKTQRIPNAQLQALTQ